MKKKGFTLAEVLISLGIIGVIAAMTTPTLISSTRNQTNATKLSSTISNLENAFTSLIAYEGTDDITDTTLWESTGDADAFTSELSRYIKVLNFEDGTASSLPTCYKGKKGLKSLNGTSLEIAPNLDKAYIEFTLPSGAAVFIAPDGTALTDTEEAAAVAAGGALFSAPAYLTLDVNGGESPNIVGRDIFCFILGVDGKLYPFGGKDVAIFKSKGEGSGTWNDSTSSYPCINTSSSGEGCTARLMEDGYKMNY